MAGYVWLLVSLVLKVFLVLLAAASVAAAQPARETPSPWAFRKLVTLPELFQPGFVELRLDSDVSRDASPTLADLRLRDANGGDVDYALRRRERIAAESTREIAMLDLVTTPPGAVRFALDAGPGRIVHNRVRLTIRDQARNFRVPVRVETADDGRTWQLAREAGFIYRVEGETKAADTSVSYPSSTARWVRVTVGPERGRVLPLAGAALVLAATPEREEERVTASLVERDEETMRRTTRLVIDLRSRRPVDRIELDVAERNFHRVALIEASDDRKIWRWAGSCAISAVDAGKIRERLTGTRFPETTARYLRVTIQNLDDRPLTVTGARVFAVKRTIVFEATPGRAYVLDYGNPAAAAPRYDVARAMTDLGGDKLPEATLGTARPVPAPPPAPWLASQPIVMWASMAMAVLVLGSLLWRMACSVRTAD
jgi:uncharacterized protein DUF3999